MLNYDRQQILPIELGDPIREKQKAMKPAQRTLNPRHKAEANRLNARVKEELQKIREETLQDKISHIEANPQKIRKLVKSLR